MTERRSRIDAEWIALNAFRGLAKIASKGDIARSTYNNALDLGGELYPELLGSDTSVLRRERESDTAKEFRQRAELLSIRENRQVAPLPLIRANIEEINELLSIAERNRSDRTRVDQLKKRLGQLVTAEKELNTVAHTENQLIFRDAYGVDRNLPSIVNGQGHRDFRLPDNNVLRVRVLHPDKPEHVSGADIIYERHNPGEEEASIVAVQYKLWEDKVLYLSDARMEKQLNRLRGFICENDICAQANSDNTYRFPCCSAFLRPTDKLQKVDQKYASTGEHVPICRIDDCKTVTTRGATILEYKNIRDMSLNGEMFEYLFNKGKIGSRMLSYTELRRLYTDYLVELSESNVVIYAQEFLAPAPLFRDVSFSEY